MSHSASSSAASQRASHAAVTGASGSGEPKERPVTVTGAGGSGEPKERRVAVTGAGGSGEPKERRVAVTGAGGSGEPKERRVAVTGAGGSGEPKERRVAVTGGGSGEPKERRVTMTGPAPAVMGGVTAVLLSFAITSFVLGRPGCQVSGWRRTGSPLVLGLRPVAPAHHCWPVGPRLWFVSRSRNSGRPQGRSHERRR